MTAVAALLLAACGTGSSDPAGSSTGQVATGSPSDLEHPDGPDLGADDRPGARGRRTGPVPRAAADRRHADLPPAPLSDADGAPDQAGPRGEPGSSGSPSRRSASTTTRSTSRRSTPRRTATTTPTQVAQFQQEWNRIARGEMALRPQFRRQVPKDGFVAMGARSDAPQIHVGVYAPQIPQVDAIVNESWVKTLGMRRGNALLVSTGIHTPLSIRKPIQQIVGGRASVQRMDAAARFGLDPSVAQTALLVGTTADAVGAFSYTVLDRWAHRTAAVVGRLHISTETMPIIGPMTCNTSMFPQLRAALERDPDARAGERDPPEPVRRVLRPALHRRHHDAVQPRLRPGLRPQRPGERARHRRPDQPPGGRDLRDLGLHLGRHLALHRPDALRAEPTGARGLISAAGRPPARGSCGAGETATDAARRTHRARRRTEGSSRRTGRPRAGAEG